ncbi:DUF5678 domain-containing protein [Dehalococcoidia bacterium]|nr:DUF5678 domain-containing protein [Dehalococcoidia bacterium]MCL0058389.1 DUF5678 domain-containing protein [Dehalococcoidia bacterium]MCL0070045.1 DUF5678 domain-containing protein [Dehalococcoidia bacterium]MCL0078478.1 DUF5678 domain-containing protein [Dehalococcoidia bacterium]MCL0089138.1 DUF5678 domain-containing protein [Dehalococcoidia bacterium]
MQTERARNQRAYQELKEELDKNYRGRFVAIAQGRIVADGLSFEETIKKAEEAAPGVSQRIVLKIGEEYPRSTIRGMEPTYPTSSTGGRMTHFACFYTL